jgi:hypothetical protein
MGGGILERVPGMQGQERVRCGKLLRRPGQGRITSTDPFSVTAARRGAVLASVVLRRLASSCCLHKATAADSPKRLALRRDSNSPACRPARAKSGPATRPAPTSSNPGDPLGSGVTLGTRVGVTPKPAAAHLRLAPRAPMPARDERAVVNCPVWIITGRKPLVPCSGSSAGRAAAAAGRFKHCAPHRRSHHQL